ncbi:MAG: glycosyltransferase family 8 protein [Bacteroidales bacterium]|nr:glycosyltransferase family 8 protein [Bacteroidales bacterium]
MNKKINILCATDDKYVPWCGIMLTSVLENNPADVEAVYIMTAGLERKNVAAFESLADKYKVSVNLVQVSSEDMTDFSVRDDCPITIATWLRLLAAKVLPPEVEKILYLDCDIIVNGSLKELFEMDMEGYAVAAVPDESCHNDEYYQRLEIPRDSLYFNAGVLLMNLKHWRETNVLKRCLAFIRSSAEKLYLYDQDVLNKVLYQEKKWISFTYNFQNGFLWSWQLGFYSEEQQEAIRKDMNNPVVIHYSGPAKPWQKMCYNPYVPFFLHYRGISLWKDAPLTGELTIKDRLLHLKHTLAVALHLRKPLYLVPRKKWHSA